MGLWCVEGGSGGTLPRQIDVVGRMEKEVNNVFIPESLQNNK